MPPPIVIGAGPLVVRARPGVPLRDNTVFAQKFDAAKVVEVFRPTRTVVVSQSITSGEMVPVGTAIDLVVTARDLLPVESFRDFDITVAQKFAGKNVGDVLAALKDTDAKKVLDRAEATSYETLSSNEKVVMNQYIRQNFGVDAEGNPEKAKAIYGNLKFLNDV